MIADMINKKKLNPIEVRLNTTHIFIMKMSKKRDFWQIVLNN